MSHFTVLVCLPAWASDIDTELDKALAPFDENMAVSEYPEYQEGAPEEHWWYKSQVREGKWLHEGPPSWAQIVGDYPGRADEERLYLDDDGRAYSLSTYNPSSKWDWWQIGGRWTRSLISKVPARSFDAKFLIQGSPGVFGSDTELETPDNTLRCDGGPVRLLDFARMRMEAEAEAARHYDVWEEICASTPPLKYTWEHLRSEVQLKEFTIEEAREKYNAQPRIQAAKARSRELGRRDFLAEPVEQEFILNREDHLRRAYWSGVGAFALLTKEGTWHEKGAMGWFGMSDDTPETRDRFVVQMNKYLDTLDPDDIVVMIDAHI